jgi:outer membrane protein W
LIQSTLQKIYRLIFMLFLAAGAARTSAQTVPSSDVGVWIVSAELNETTLIDEDDEIRFDFEEDLGYGISFNRYWTNAFSTEIALQKLGADATIGVANNPTVTVGEMDITTITGMGQLHFNRTGRFAPYVGGGVAWVSGEFEAAVFDEPEDESIDLESELTWTAAVGAHVHLTGRIALVGEVKYISWKAMEEGGTEEDALDVDPLTFAAGVKVRF